MKKLRKAQVGEIANQLSGPNMTQGAGFLWNGISKDSPKKPEDIVNLNKQKDNSIYLNWNHILQSQLFTGALQSISNASANSYQNATLRFNQQQYNPINYLPQNPNYSKQDYYGNMQEGGIIDGFIKEFLFGDDSNPSKEDPVIKKKAPTSDSRVSETDVEEITYEEEVRKRESSAQRIARLLSAINMQEQQDEQQSYTAQAPFEIKASGKFGTQNVGPYGQQIISDIQTALGYSPTFNSIYRDAKLQEQLIAQGKPAVKNSWHLTGNAVDMKPEDWNNLSPDKQKYFKDNYNVIYHNNHYHIEPGSKNKKNFGGAVPFGFHMMPDGTIMSDKDMEYKKGGIRIKPENKGKFTAWAKRHGYSMSEAIKAGKKSDDPRVRKMATFAANARKWKHEDGGIINTTGYTFGSETEDNPMNIIPGGDITMQDVYRKVLAIPFKNNKSTTPLIMNPNTDYSFDADYVMEFAIGGEYDVTEDQLEMLKKLGYEYKLS